MPRPDATSAFIAAAASPYVKPAIFFLITFTTGPVYVWSGVGTVNFNGAAWIGVGRFGNISTIEEGTNVQARGIVATLSGIDPVLLNDVLYEYRQGLPAVVYLGLFGPNGNLIPNPICCWSGRTDQPTLTVNGDSATIEVACENRLVEMNTSVERRYTSDDQQIDFPGDLGFSYVNPIQNITIYWGRHPSASNNFGVQGTPS